MKIFNIEFYIHEHKYEDKFDVFRGATCDWEIKAYKTCVTPNCKELCNKATIWIKVNGKKPDVVSVIL